MDILTRTVLTDDTPANEGSGLVIEYELAGVGNVGNGDPLVGTYGVYPDFQHFSHVIPGMCGGRTAQQP